MRWVTPSSVQATALPLSRATALLSGVLGLIELAVLALQDRQIHQRRGELRVLQRDLLEVELGLGGVAGAHEAHGAVEVGTRGRRHVGMHARPRPTPRRGRAPR